MQKQNRGMVYPKILVGCPTSSYHKYCIDEYKKSVRSIKYDNYDIVLVDNSEDNEYYKNLEDDRIRVIKTDYSDHPIERIVRSRNILRDIVLNKGYDYFLSLEQDVIAPYDIIGRFLLRKKDIVSGVYFGEYIRNKQKRILPMLWVLKKDDKNRTKYVPVKRKFLNSNKMYRVDICGLGCVLISRKVLEGVKFRYTPNLKKQFDDVHFCVDAVNQGFKIFTDTSVKCRHMIRERPWSWKELLK